METKAQASQHLLLGRAVATDCQSTSCAMTSADGPNNGSVETLAHDLRNSLATISNLISFLDARLKAKPDMELQRVVDATMVQVRQMSQFIDEWSHRGDADA